MIDKQIKQNAKNFAINETGGLAIKYFPCEKGYIAGAHSRDEEINALHDLLDVYERELDKLRNPWISVNDRLPDDNQVVLAHHEIIIDGGGEHKEDENVTIQRYVGEWITDRIEQQRMGKWLFDITDRVTHWMPIPETPERR